MSLNCCWLDNFHSQLYDKWHRLTWNERTQNDIHFHFDKRHNDRTPVSVIGNDTIDDVKVFNVRYHRLAVQFHPPRVPNDMQSKKKSSLIQFKSRFSWRESNFCRLFCMCQCVRCFWYSFISPMRNCSQLNDYCSRTEKSTMHCRVVSLARISRNFRMIEWVILLMHARACMSHISQRIEFSSIFIRCHQISVHK